MSCPWIADGKFGTYICGPGWLLSELPYQQAARQLHLSGMVCRNALIAVVTFCHSMNQPHALCRCGTMPAMATCTA